PILRDLVACHGAGRPLLDQLRDSLHLPPRPVLLGALSYYSALDAAFRGSEAALLAAGTHASQRRGGGPVDRLEDIDLEGVAADWPALRGLFADQLLAGAKAGESLNRLALQVVLEVVGVEAAEAPPEGAPRPDPVEGAGETRPP